MKSQRDVLIGELVRAAKLDEDIYFLSADFGAPALDEFRTSLPNQFLHLGISEQNMIDVAAGLSLAGKKVFVYAMGPFITLRCLEQIKCSLAMMELPVTIISVGLGLGYADAGPTHYLTEDYSALKGIVGLEILTPSSNDLVVEIANACVISPKLRILRLDRTPFDLVEFGNASNQLNQGFREYPAERQAARRVVLGSGYALDRAFRQLEARGLLEGLRFIDLFSNNFDPSLLKDALVSVDKIVVIDEQCGAHGLPSIVTEFLLERRLFLDVEICSLEPKYYFNNVGRDGLLDEGGMSVDKLCEKLF